MNYIWSIGRLLKNANISGTNKNPTATLRSENTNTRFFLQKKKKDLKNAKITKQSDVYKGYVSTNNVEILNSLNPEVRFKDFCN